MLQRRHSYIVRSHRLQLQRLCSVLDTQIQHCFRKSCCTFSSGLLEQTPIWRVSGAARSVGRLLPTLGRRLRRDILCRCYRLGPVDLLDRRQRHARSVGRNQRCACQVVSRRNLEALTR